MQENDSKPKSFTSDTVISKDGTQIGYRSIGRGPGLILVQGAMGTIENFTDLAQALADSFTIYLPERRGRGMSPKVFTADYSVDNDVEDIAALLKKTGAEYVFGLSSGAVIALQAALELPAIKKLAVYEPALMVDGLPKALGRFKADMAKGDIPDALVTAMKASEMGPGFLRRMPSRLLMPLVKKLLKQEGKKAGSDKDKFWHNVAPALQFDFKAIEDVSPGWQKLQGIKLEVLLLGGSKSPNYLHRALDALEKTLPKSKRIEFEGLDHGAAWNYHKRQNPHGNPRRVAQELRQFFSAAQKATATPTPSASPSWPPTAPRTPEPSSASASAPSPPATATWGPAGTPGTPTTAARSATPGTRSRPSATTSLIALREDAA